MSLILRPYPKHDSSEIIHIRHISYKQEVEAVRYFFKEEHQNWIPVDSLRSKWWIWNNILKEVSVSMKNIYSYLERRSNSEYDQTFFVTSKIKSMCSFEKMLTFYPLN